MSVERLIVASVVKAKKHIPPHYLMSLLCTTVANASPSSCITIFDTSAPEAPGISLSPTQSSAINTSYPRRAPSRAVVETQTCA